MRLNKFLAHSGVCSRRAADLLIESGRVAVNGVTVRTLGVSVDERTDKVSVDGKKISLHENLVYILLNKPKGHLSTVKDDFKRPTVLDLVGKEKKVFPVGRLDLNTEGILLLTNDGELTFRLTHPKFEIEKIYSVTVRGKIDQEILARFRQGVKLEEGVVARGDGRIIKSGEKESVFELRLKEGRKREIKRMCLALGLRVTKLMRTHFANLTARGLKAGEWRYLSDREVHDLMKLAGL